MPAVQLRIKFSLSLSLSLSLASLLITSASSTRACERIERETERSGAGRIYSRVSGSGGGGVMTFQKTLERGQSVEQGREAAEQERSGQRAKSACQSHLTPNISPI